MLISEVSKEFSIPIETLRYYDKIGLLTPERIHNNRYYTEQDLIQLKSILYMKKMMFTLDEIKNIIQMDEIIDEGFQKNCIDKEAISLLLLQVKAKYKETVNMEKDIKQIKIKLEEIISKAEMTIQEDER